MGDIDGGDAELALDAAELELHLLAQLAVQRGQRLVEQQEVGLEDQRAGDGDALLLAAGELVDAPLAQPAEPHEIEIPLDPFGNGARIAAAHFQRKGDVLGRRHMRESARRWKTMPIERRCGGTALTASAVDEDLAAGRRLESRRSSEAASSCPSRTGRGW